MKVDSLERSKQHRNMHRLSTCHRDRRVTDTVPQTRAQISDIRRARADSVRSLKHAGTCTLPPQAHGWATLPPRGTATCKMGVHRQPLGGSTATIARFRSHAHAHIAKVCTHAPSSQQSFPLPPLPPLPAPDRPERPWSPNFARRGSASRRLENSERPSRWSSQIDASGTTASGIDLWTTESVSARS